MERSKRGNRFIYWGAPGKYCINTQKNKYALFAYKGNYLGEKTRTSVAVIYIENLTNKKLVEEVMDRLKKINIDGATTAGSIEENIIDNKRTIFPLV